MGVIVYQLCDGQRSLCNLIDEISNQYQEVTREVVEKDVKNFVMPLVEMGFLRQKESGESNE